MLAHYCDRCIKFVLVESGYFRHPHQGIRPCKVCWECGGMIYMKEQGV